VKLRGGGRDRGGGGKKSSVGGVTKGERLDEECFSEETGRGSRWGNWERVREEGSVSKKVLNKNGRPRGRELGTEGGCLDWRPTQGGGTRTLNQGGLVRLMSGLLGIKVLGVELAGSDV